MVRDEHWAEHFVRLEQVAEIAAAVAAGKAWAALIERFAIECVLQVTKANRAVIGEGQGVASIASGHNAVEKVHASADTFEQVDRAADSHQIAGAIARQ